MPKRIIASANKVFLTILSRRIEEEGGVRQLREKTGVSFRRKKDPNTGRGVV